MQYRSKVRFFFFYKHFVWKMKEVSYAHQGCIYLFKNTVIWGVLFQFTFNILKNKNNCDGNANAKFSAAISSVSHDTSEIILICWFGVQELFIIIILKFFKIT